MVMQPKTIIGRVSTAEFPIEKIRDVPVKIDTGADSSAIWASNVHIDHNHVLHYTLFDTPSPHYTGKVHATTHYKVTVVRSSNGFAQVRYRVKLLIVLGGRQVRGTFTLADRSANTYPVLVGCKLLRNKFLVDVAKGKVASSMRDEHGLQEELDQNPRAFYEKYHLNNHRGDIVL